MSQSHKQIVAGLLRFDLTALRHPSWWVALALLLVNDNALKGHGVAPSWLTGKLSDFAFLVVAPVVLAALLPVGLPWRRTLALSSIVALYVVTDLSPVASDAVVAAAAHLGMRWQLWPDPTDLLALAVLPWTVRLLRSPPRPARARRSMSAERLGLVVGSLACLATSRATEYPHRPFFVNQTDGSVELRVTWVLRKVHCATSPDRLSASLTSGDLDDPRPLKVASGQIAVLDGIPEAGDSPVGHCHLERNRYSGDGSNDCVAAILETGDAQPVLMLAPREWTESDGRFFACSHASLVSNCRPKLDLGENAGPDAVALLGSGKSLRLQGVNDPTTPWVKSDGGSGSLARVRVTSVDLAAIARRPVEAESCRAIKDAYQALPAEPCSGDGDCRVLRSLPGQAPAGVCGKAVSKQSAAQAEQLLGTWSALCSQGPTQCEIQPALCIAGSCSQACAGIPVCAPSCGTLGTTEPPDGGAACNYLGFACLDDAGSLCGCTSLGDYACNPQPIAVPGCPPCKQAPRTTPVGFDAH